MSNPCPKSFKYIPLIVILTLLLSLLNVSPVFAAPCGNGVCQESLGETCETCPEDCGECPIPEPSPEPTPDGEPTPTPEPGATPTPTPAPSEEGEAAPAIVYYPSVTLTSYSPDPTNKTSLTFSGKASIEQGTIASAEYTITAGSEWIATQPSDGNFNTKDENFTFSIPTLAEGAYTVKVRAKSLAGIYTQSGSYASDTFTIVTTPPKVTLDEITPNPTKNQTPTISGRASSKLAGISRAEISVDDKETWLGAKLIGGKFSLTLEKLEDGNYPIWARAFDTAGNVGESEPQILIIDTIPPIIGGSMVALGSQLLTPDADGAVRVVAGAQITMAMSMKGGVTEATLITEDETFPLTSIAGTNLWSGKLVFNKEGEKALIISAVDGAGNKTERPLNSLLMEGFGIVQDKKNGKPVDKAVVSVFFFDTISKTWVLWEGQSYGQENPQTTGGDGKYSFMVPSGRYYLEVKASGFRTMRSEITDLSENSILNFTFPLTPKPKISLNLPFIGEITLALPSLFPPETLSQDKLVKPQLTLSLAELTLQPGVEVPDFSLPDREGNLVGPSQFLGKRLLLTFFTPWSPHSLEQVPILDEVSKSSQETQEILGIALQESVAVTEVFMRRGSYTFLVVADKNGETAADYKITTLPQHFFIDSQGKIQQVYVGVLGKEELLEKLNRLE